MGVGSGFFKQIEDLENPIRGRSILSIQVTPGNLFLKVACTFSVSMLRSSRYIIFLTILQMPATNYNLLDRRF